MVRSFTVFIALMFILALGGCGSSTSTVTITTCSPPSGTPTGAPAPHPFPEISPQIGQYWANDLLVVTLVATNHDDAASVNVADAIKQINTVLTPHATVSLAAIDSGNRIVQHAGYWANTYFLQFTPTSWTLVQSIDTVNQKIVDGTLNKSGNARFAGASPDWSMVGSTWGTSIAGSPAGDPLAYCPNYLNTTPVSSNASAPVYVLDASPSVKTSGMNLSEYYTMTNTELIAKIDLTSDSTIDRQLKSIPLTTKMESMHGVFIATLIRHLVEDNPIHLVRVLNESGAGDLLTLSWGLQQVKEPNAIVNLSLEVGPSTDDLLKYWNCSTYTTSPNQCPITYTLGGTDPSWDYQQLLFIPIMAILPERTLIAAAGNDHGKSAGMPAVFCSVTSVVSTDRTGNVSSFSNQSGLVSHSNACLKLRPTPSTDQNNCPSTTGKGIHCNPYALSISSSRTGNASTPQILGENICSFAGYMGGVPQYALWQGTSFATALYTGNVAQGNKSAPYHTDQPCA